MFNGLDGRRTPDTQGSPAIFRNKTFDTAAGNTLKVNGTTLSAVSGTGAVLLQNNPTVTGTLTAAAANFSGLQTISSSSFVAGRSIPASGVGLELYYSGGASGILSYDRTTPGHKPLTIDALSTTINAFGSPVVTITSSLVTLSQPMNYGGVTLSNSVTGTGGLVLRDSPTLTGTLTAAAATFSGTVETTSSQMKVTGSTPIMRWNQTGTGANVWRWQASVNNYGDFGIYNEATASIPFMVAPDNSVLVSTPVTGGWSGAAKFEVKAASSGNYGGSFYNTAGPASLFRVDNNSYALLDFRSSTAPVGSITTNGSSTAYNATSDKTLKFDYGLQNNGNLFDRPGMQVHDSAWRNNIMAPRFAALFAQDLYEELPHTVRPGNDNSPWQVDHIALIPYLIAELQAHRRILRSAGLLAA